MNKRIYVLFFQVFVLILSLIVSSFLIDENDETIPIETGVDKEQLIATLENEIPKLMDRALIPGLSIAVIREGELIWEDSFGVKDINTKDSVTSETVFEAASLSKPVFSYAVMKMAERGELDIDKPLVEYASDEYIEENYLGRAIDDERFRKITTRMVLSHQTGFPNWRGNAQLKINFEPGDRFGYSGEGFGYLQKIIEIISGLSLNEFASKEIFIPLGMTHSSYNWEERYEELTSFPHNIMMEVGEKSKYTVGHAAAYLHATASDYAKFLVAIINHTGLEASTIDTMLSPHVVVNTNETPKIDWGLGFGLERTKEGNFFWHWGDNGDFKCFFIADPKLQTGVVYFTNSCYGLSIRKQIVQLTIGGDHPVMNSSLLSNYGDVDSPWMQFVRILVTENVEAALEKYDALAKEYPATEIIPEYQMNDIGYSFMRKKQLQSAISIFMLNVEIYPDSWNVYDSLGEAYMESGDYELAISNYRKSLKLNPKNDNAEKMIERIKTQQ